jgi:outer membrane PBP1 activator LpoA protein
MKLTDVRVLAAALGASLLWGCSSKPPSTPPTTVEPSYQERELSEVEQLLLQAQTATPTIRAQYTLEAAERLLAQQQPQAALQQLNQTNPVLLTESLRSRYWLLQAEASLQLQQPQQTLNWLSMIYSPSTLSSDDFQRYQRLLADTHSLQGDYLATTKALIAESQSTTLDRQAELAGQIWQTLLQLSDEQLEQQLQQQNSYQEQGWFELALLHRRHQRDILQLNQELDNWFELWGMHPAASQLPYELQQVRQFGASMPGHIAILLPQSGSLARHGNAIIEGLMAAYFQQRQFGTDTPQLSFFDSALVSDLDAFYFEARQQGIELVIGPLDKNNLHQLTERAAVPIPTLALNAIDSATSTLNLFQFGLRNQDEAIQSAERAWNDGHRVALTLTPATSWGQQVQQSFNQRWQQLGGEIAASQEFSGISRLVAADSSERRASELAQTIGQRIEFEPRRRQDVDLLFLAALNEDARQIKPTLAFHYAGDLPVYASSHLFDGKPDQSRYQDLATVRFNAIPWVLDSDNPLRASLSEFRDNTRTRFGRLYALGADSYRLAPYLNQLHNLPDAYLQGHSGQLSINLLGHINRRQAWAQIRNNGSLRPLPIADQDVRE